ncbi:MAG: TonB-dependent receptor, partial [Rhodoblastus sp.]|nr:TonB-dependent receptor [Rhodoblastus sp.]
PSYAVVDARLGYKVNENISLSLNVSNLFDTTYVPYPFPRAVYGEPRRATLKFVGRW